MVGILKGKKNKKLPPNPKTFKTINGSLSMALTCIQIDCQQATSGAKKEVTLLSGIGFIPFGAGFFKQMKIF